MYVELPRQGDHVKQMKVMGVVESVKAASDLYSPISGEVVAVNEAAVGSPERINEAPYEQGWLIRVRPDDQSELDSLMTANDYDEHVNERGAEE